MKNLDAGSPWDRQRLAKLFEDLKDIRQRMLALEHACRERIAGLHPMHQGSGCNLLHYLALRQQDMRSAQQALAALGLSSLGRTESHVLASLESLLQVVGKLADLPFSETAPPSLSFAEGSERLSSNTVEVLGPSPGHRDVRIMVTMPSQAASDYLLVKQLLASGMDCMRVNCAHDNPARWQAMVDNLRRARRELGKGCRVLMDLAGPKVRTGFLEPAEQVVRIRPRRDVYGKVVEPAQVWLMPEGDGASDHPTADAVLRFPQAQLKMMQPGDFLQFTDARGARRRLAIVSEIGSCRWAQIQRTAYVMTGLEMRLVGVDGEKCRNLKVGPVPARENFLHLHKGDTLVLTSAQELGRRARYDNQGRLISPARVACTPPEVFGDVRSGDRIWFDDGKLGGLIRRACAEELQVEIERNSRVGPSQVVDCKQKIEKISFQNQTINRFFEAKSKSVAILCN